VCEHDTFFGADFGPGGPSHLGEIQETNMASPKKRTAVTGSEKQALPNAKVIGEVDPAERIEVTVVLRPRVSAGGPRTAKALADEAMSAATQLPEQRQYLTREEFAAQRGADPADMAKVEAFAQGHNLTVIEASLAKRSVRLAGTIGDLTDAFRPNLKKTKVGKRVMRMRTGGLTVPDELADIIVAVLGFDNRPAASPHCRFLGGTKGGAATRLAAKAAPAPKKGTGKGKAGKKAAGKKAAAHPAPPAGSFTPPQVARLYDFPAGLDGSGQCIAIIELNDFDSNAVPPVPTGTGCSLSDLKAYFAALGLPAPDVTAVGVASDGAVGANVPGVDHNADGEVMLDIEVAGAVAPRAKIAVYFALNTDNGFLAALNAALHDAVRKPSVISISWGSAEDFNTQQARDAFNQALADASHLGVTVCCSSGDDGSSDLTPAPAMPDGGRHQDGHPHVDFPASSPFALACGGTALRGSGTTIQGEVVWNQGNGGTGGGVSNVFARPAYQSNAKVPKSPKGKIGRGVPDVAGDAAPDTGYQVRLVGGASGVIGGTSAVAPLWAGLIALMNQRLATLGKPPVGFLNPLIYQFAPATGTFHDIVTGNNDIEGLNKYKSGIGWDPCTGLGTPDGAKLLKALGG
jgi:kumamolisin